ncbi:hypothetical protein [Leyella lascolaii]|uniref:hypothetical protein n=1 Tax=Leyella lascolaii TaxID=1776379 RepID=UPI000AD5ACDB|nr:hypothetical protein [Leyella lascolaii]
MRNIILLFFLSVTYGMAAAQSRTDSLYSLLDEAIANSDRYGVSGNLVGISINLCKSIQKELFINDTP